MIALCVLPAGGATGPSTHPPPSPLPTGTGPASARELTFANGARALLLPRAGSGSVLVAVSVGTGAQDEPADRIGMSHFLEHLLFDGFDGMDERGVTEAFEALASYVNAFTRDQATVYFALTPREDASRAAALLAGMLTRSTIPEAAFEKERKVILEELAREAAQPAVVRDQAARAALWQDSPWARSAGGTAETVRAVTRDQVVAFWKRHYAPGAMKILAIGDADLATLAAILAPLEALPVPAAPPGRSGPPRPVTERPSPRSFPHWGTWISAPAGEEAPQLTLALVPPEGVAGGPALDVLAKWLGDDGGPVSQTLVGHGATEISAGRLPRRPDDVVEITVTAAEGQDPQDLLARTLGAVEAASVGPLDAESARLGRAWTSERALTRQRLHYTAVLDGEALAAADSLAAAIDPPAPTGSELRALAAAMLAGAGSRTRAVWSGPGGPATRVPLPAPSTPPPATASAIAAGPRGSRVATLPNGLVLAVLEEPGSPVFGIHLLVADRTAREPAGQDGAADLAHRLLGGGSQLSPGESFERRLQRAGVDLTPADNPMIPMDDRYHVAAWSYVREEGPADELDAALELLAEMVRQPRWSAAAWEAALTEHRQSRRAGGQGSARLDTALRARLLGPEHPLARPASGRPDGTPPSEDQVKAFWGDGAGGYFAPSTLILTVASPWDAAAVLERVQELFGAGPAGEPARFAYPEPGPPVSSVTAGMSTAQDAAASTGPSTAPAPPAAPPAVSPAVPGGPPQGMPPGMPSGRPPGAPAGMPPGMPGSPPAGMPPGGGKGPGAPPPQLGLAWGRIAAVPPAERAALLVAVSALEDRMTAELREKQGLLYRHDAGVRALPRGEWLISASFSTRPENEPQATAAFASLLAGLAAQPLPTADVERMLDRARRRAMLDGQSAVSRAYTLGRQLYEGEASPLGITLAELERVTPEAVQAAAAAWLDPSRMVRVQQ